MRVESQRTKMSQVVA